ncbi:MAG TPA: hypothetical protein VF721_08265 [Pyrinomonadaceae bacterium]|jgi:hypothetical protein
MKKLLLATLLLSFSSLAILAQDYEAPPPPLIYLAPRADEIKEFVSKENNFSISFPGVPKTAAKKTEESTENVFSVYRSGSNSIVSVWEFKNDVENNREEILERYRKGILNFPFPGGAEKVKPTMTSENDFQIGKYKGREFAYEAGLKFTKVRLLFVGKRIYEIKTDVTNWHILSEYQKANARDFERETERFFSSFRLLN